MEEKYGLALLLVVFCTSILSLYASGSVISKNKTEDVLTF